MWQNIFLVGIGSMLGGVGRYLLSHFIRQHIDSAFPWGTFVVNITGCLLIGYISGLFPHESIQLKQRMLFSVGFCGSFTTFSTFSMEGFTLYSHKSYCILAIYIFSSILLGLTATGIGLWLGNKSSV